MGKLIEEVGQRAGWTDRQKEAVMTYYSGKYHANYYEAAKHLGVTRERVRQLVMAAMHKLIRARTVD